MDTTPAEKNKIKFAEQPKKDTKKSRPEGRLCYKSEETD